MRPCDIPMSNARFNGTATHGATDEQIIERCAYLHERGIYPSKVNCAVSCENARFSRVRRFWAEANGVLLTRGRFAGSDPRQRQNIVPPSPTEEEIIARCRELVAQGRYPSFSAAAMMSDDRRFASVRNAWIERERITLPTIRRDPRPVDPPRSHKSHAEQAAAKPKKSKYATREMRFIAHILKRVEKGGAN